MKEFFKRNKKVLIFSLVIFLVCAIGSAIFAYSSVGENYGAISNALWHKNVTGNQTSNMSFKLNTIDLFLHNLLADYVLIAGGLLFSVFSVLITIFNGVIIGIPFGTDLTYSLVTILPHGILEYSATVFALACAFNITKLEIKMIKNRSFKSTLIENKRALKDILIMCMIVFILLLIAAIIECNLIDPIATWYYGLN